MNHLIADRYDSPCPSGEPEKEICSYCQEGKPDDELSKDKKGRNICIDCIEDDFEEGTLDHLTGDAIDLYYKFNPELND